MPVQWKYSRKLMQFELLKVIEIIVVALRFVFIWVSKKIAYTIPNQIWRCFPSLRGAISPKLPSLFYTHDISSRKRRLQPHIVSQLFALSSSYVRIWRFSLTEVEFLLIAWIFFSLSATVLASSKIPRFAYAILSVLYLGIWARDSSTHVPD